MKKHLSLLKGLLEDKSFSFTLNPEEMMQFSILFRWFLGRIYNACVEKMIDDILVEDKDISRIVNLPTPLAAPLTVKFIETGDNKLKSKLAEIMGKRKEPLFIQVLLEAFDKGIKNQETDLEYMGSIIKALGDIGQARSLLLITKNIQKIDKGLLDKVRYAINKIAVNNGLVKSNISQLNSLLEKDKEALICLDGWKFARIQLLPGSGEKLILKISGEDERHISFEEFIQTYSKRWDGYIWNKFKNYIKIL